MNSTLAFFGSFRERKSWVKYTILVTTRKRADGNIEIEKKPSSSHNSWSWQNSNGNSYKSVLRKKQKGTEGWW